MKSLRNYPLSLLTTAVICVLSLAPIGGIELDVKVPLADKWTHFVMYGTLTTVIWWEYWKQHDHADIQWLSVFGAVCPILLGALMEVLQANCTTYRSGDWLDAVANSIGVVLGVVLGILVIRPWWQSRRSRAVK